MKVYSYLEYCQSSVFYQMDFEGWLKRHYDRRDMNSMHFYSQPFKPELITELFEGRGSKDRNVYGLPKEGAVLKFYTNEYCLETHRDQWDLLEPRTLDDFINDCQRAGIELEWKQ